MERPTAQETDSLRDQAEADSLRARPRDRQFTKLTAHVIQTALLIFEDSQARRLARLTTDETDKQLRSRRMSVHWDDPNSITADELQMPRLPIIKHM